MPSFNPRPNSPRELLCTTFFFCTVDNELLTRKFFWNEHVISFFSTKAITEKYRNLNRDIDSKVSPKYWFAGARTHTYSCVACNAARKGTSN